MKSVFSAIALSGLLVVGGAGTASAYDLTFDGFCDGLTINLGTDLHAFGSYNGCRTSAVSGNVNLALRPAPVLAHTISPNETTEVPVGWTYIVNFDAGRTWCLYMSGDLFQCGTWSPGVASADAAGSPATGE
jgi:hypothetical protein